MKPEEVANFDTHVISMENYKHVNNAKKKGISEGHNSSYQQHDYKLPNNQIHLCM
jgi:hypothetical protein